MSAIATRAHDEEDIGDLGIGTESAVQQLVSTAAPVSQTVPIEHFDLNVLRDAFKLVKADLDLELQNAAPDASVKVRIQGLGRAVYQHQLGAAFWLLVRERSHCRGGILADKMGLGKTTTILLYIYLNSLLVENALEVKNEPEKHQTPAGDGPCPSQSRWPIQCKCVRRGVVQTYKLSPRPGASLVVVPATLLATWKSEFAGLQVSKTEGLRLYIQHQQYPDDSAPLHERSHLALYGHGDGDTVDNKPHEYSRAHNIILVTTAGSYRQHVLRRFACYRYWRDPHSQRVQRLTDGIAYGRVVRDEAHLASKEGSLFDKIMETLIHSGWTPPNYVAVTGTPILRGTVEEILPIVRCFSRISPNFAKDPTLKGICTPTELMEKTTPAEIANVLTAYAIQRTNGTRQLERALAPVPSLQIRDVFCTLSVSPRSTSINKQDPRKLTRHLPHSMPGEPDDSKEGEVGVGMLLANIPGLASVDYSKVTWKHIEREGWHKDPTTSNIFAAFDELEATSAKLQKLRTIITTLNPNAGDDTDKATEGVTDHHTPSTPASEGRERCKLVVVTYFPVVCLAVKVLCIQLGVECEWLSANLDCVARAEKIFHFQNVHEPGEDGDSIQVLVGTYAILGQGVSLTAARHLVLVEPHGSLAMEMQVFRRICRPGSTARECWVYRLHNPTLEKEKARLAGHMDQLELDWALQRMDVRAKPSKRAEGARNQSLQLQPRLERDPLVREEVGDVLDL